MFQKKQKATRDKTIKQKPYQRNTYLGCPSCKIFGTFLKWDREELKQINQRTRKLMTLHKAYYMCQEKKDEKDVPALKTTLTHRYNDLKTS